MKRDKLLRCLILAINDEMLRIHIVSREIEKMLSVLHTHWLKVMKADDKKFLHLQDSAAVYKLP